MAGERQHDDVRLQALLDEVRAPYARQPGLAESEWGGLEWGQGVPLLSHERYAKAEAALRKSAALYSKQFGADGSNAAGIDALIARAAGKQSRHAEAAPPLERATPILQRGASCRLLKRAPQAWAELDLDRADLAHAAQSVSAVQAQVLGWTQSRVWADMFEARLATANGQQVEVQARMQVAQQLASEVFKDAPGTRRTLAKAAAAIEHGASGATATH